MTQSVEQDGWQSIRLGELCERIDYGFTASADFSMSEPRFLRITDIQNGQVNWDTVPGCKISEHEVVANELRDGDIVFARTGATTGKSFLIQEPPRAVFASYLIRMRLKSECDPEFLSLFFQGPDYWQQIRSQARGGAQPNFNASMLAALNVRLPPLAEQRRIAGRLREQLAEVAKARTAVQAELAAAQALPAALLRAVFDESQAKDWPRCRIDDVGRVQSGYAFKSEWFSSEGIRLLRNANVSQGQINWDDAARIPWERRSEFPSFELQVGDIILSLDRPLVGGGLKLARLTPDDVPALLLQRVGRLQLNDRVAPDYLYYFLQTDDFIQAITEHDQSLGVPHVSPKQVEEVEFALPTLDDQRAIAARLSAELAEVTRLRESLSGKLETLDRLPAALLAQSFQEGL